MGCSREKIKANPNAIGIFLVILQEYKVHNATSYTCKSTVKT